MNSFPQPIELSFVGLTFLFLYCSVIDDIILNNAFVCVKKFIFLNVYMYVCVFMYCLLLAEKKLNLMYKYIIFIVLIYFLLSFLGKKRL